MADMESKVVLTVDTKQSGTTIRDLRDDIKTYKEALSDAQIGSEEYTSILGQLTNAQNKLREAVNGATMSLDQAQGSIDTTTMSYNDLVNTMSSLNKVWRSTTDEAARNKIGANINAINDKLKALDATRGNYQRNVGDYANQMVKGFQAFAGAAGGAIAPIKNLTGGLQVMSKTPVIAILGLLANLLTTIGQKFRSSESATVALTSAFAPLKVLTQGLNVVVEGLGKSLGKVGDLLIKMADRIGINTDKMRENLELTRQAAALAEMERANIVANADAQLAVSQLRAKAAQKDIYTAKERIAFLQQAADIEAEIAKRNMEAAAIQYDTIKRQNALSASTAEEKKKEADAYAAMVAAEQAYYDKTRELNGQISEARKAAASDLQKQQDAEAKTRQQMLKDEKALYDAKSKLESTSLDERVELGKKSLAIQYELDKQEAEARIKDKTILIQTLEVLEQAYWQNISNLEASALKEIETAETQRAEAARKANEQRIKDEQAAAMALEQQRVAERDNEILRRQNEISALEEHSITRLQKEIELRQYEYDTLFQLDKESDEQFYARKLKAQEEYNKSKQALTKQEMSIAMSAASAVSGLLDSLADAYESDTDASEAELRKAKNMRIASTIINTITGALAAFTGMVQAIPGPVGLALGAVSAATVTATGLASVNKLKQTPTDANSSGGSLTQSPAASVSAPAISTAINETRNVTTASEEDRLNRMAGDQRVYILSSDLEDDRNRVQVRRTETTF